MPFTIRRAAVIGAGTMGAGIAAHLANAGVPTLLLDLPAEGADRDALARQGLERARRSRPAAFMHEDQARLIEIGNTEDDLHRLAEVDWVIEAVLERLEVKRGLLARLEEVTSEGTLVTSNSSGIPMAAQVEGRGPGFRKRFFGTHFFNPPRYLHLLEIIPGPDTDPEAMAALSGFADRVLGKGVVRAFDVPGFAANRVGAWSWLQAIRAAAELGLSPDVVDLLTGPILGRPKSATFRTADMSGNDIVYMVARNLAQATGEDFSVPKVLETMVVEKKWLGDKTGSGFYKKTRAEDGATRILTLNLERLEYEDRPRPRIPALDEIRRLPDPLTRTRALLDLEGVEGDFLRRVLFRSMHYAATMVGVVAETAREVDEAVRWGFNYELGLLETARGLGRERMQRGFEAQGLAWPPALDPILDEAEAPGEPDPEAPIQLRAWKRRPGAVVASTPDAAPVDLGQGVALLEYTSKANSLTQEVLEFTRETMERVERDFRGLVIGNQGENFSAGANLALLLSLAESGDFARIDEAVRIFQGMTSRLRYAPFPVVAAPFRLTLGGGCEVALWADAVQASAELYTGLVEIGVGILPAGGGTTETLIRKSEALPRGADPFLAVQEAFELIATAKVTGSALEARRAGFLRPSDGVTFNPDRLLGDARDRVLSLARGYVPPPRRRVTLLGEGAFANLGAALLGMHASGHITDYEVHLARTIARVLTGGEANRPAEVDEQVVLDLEREAFLDLCGQERTRARLAHTLKTGKTLRN